MDDWMLPKLTDYWDQQVQAIDGFSQALGRLETEQLDTAKQAIAACVAEHVRVMPDEILLRAVLPVVDDLYKAACSIGRWDASLEAYLAASAGTFSQALSQRNLRVQYLVDNV